MLDNTKDFDNTKVRSLNYSLLRVCNGHFEVKFQFFLLILLKTWNDYRCNENLLLLILNKALWTISNEHIWILNCLLLRHLQKNYRWNRNQCNIDTCYYNMFLLFKQKKFKVKLIYSLQLTHLNFEMKFHFILLRRKWNDYRCKDNQCNIYTEKNN